MVVGKAAFTEPSPEGKHERESASQTDQLAYSEKNLSPEISYLRGKKYSVVFNLSCTRLKINSRSRRKITNDNFPEIFIVPGDVSNNF